MFFFLPKNFKLNKKDIKPNKKNIKNILNISIPTTGSRLIGNIGYLGITTEECISNQQINSIIVNENHDIDFVYYLLNPYLSLNVFLM